MERESNSRLRSTIFKLQLSSLSLFSLSLSSLSLYSLSLSLLSLSSLCKTNFLNSSSLRAFPIECLFYFTIEPAAAVCFEIGGIYLGRGFDRTADESLFSCFFLY